MLTREGMTIFRRRVALQVASVRFLSPLKGQTEHLQLSLHGVEISGPLTARIKVSVRSTIFFRHEIILFRSRHVSPVEIKTQLQVFASGARIGNPKVYIIKVFFILNLHLLNYR